MVEVMEVAKHSPAFDQRYCHLVASTQLVMETVKELVMVLEPTMALEMVVVLFCHRVFLQQLRRLG